MLGTNLKGPVPIFIFPNNLTYYINDEASHKQVLTIYNPYNFAIAYQILSNAPEKYLVVDPSGSLDAQNRIDIIVRHLAPVERNIGQADKLRIKITKFGGNEILGKKDIELSLKIEIDVSKLNEIDTSLKSNFQQGLTLAKDPVLQELTGRENDNIMYLFSMMMILSTIILLPTTGSPHSNIPLWLHMTHPVQLTCAFAAGIITTLLVQRFS